MSEPEPDDVDWSIYRNRADTLANRLRDVRSDTGLSRREAAERASITRGYLQKLEAGDKVNPTFKTLSRLARVYGGQIGDMLAGTVFPGPGESGWTFSHEMDEDPPIDVDDDSTGRDFRS